MLRSALANRVGVILQKPSSGAGRSVFGGIKTAIQDKLAERGQKKQAEEFTDTIHELAQTSRYDLVAFEQYLDVSAVNVSSKFRL